MLRSSWGSSGSGEYGPSQVIIPPVKSNLLSTSRVLDIFMITLFTFVVILHIICFVMLERKHAELVDKFRDNVTDIEDHCILFITHNDNQWLLVNNNCDLVIRGSEALTGCASIMIILLGVRSVLFKK